MYSGATSAAVCWIASSTNAPFGAKSAHIETGINQLDSRHDVLHAVVDVAVSAGLSGCQDFMQVLQNRKAALRHGPILMLTRRSHHR